MASFTFHRNVKRNRPDHDLDSDSDDELFLMNDSWPRFIVMSSASEEKPLSKLSPFRGAEGLPGNSRNPQEHQEAERWILPRGVLQNSPG